ncbi:hypothetical protein CSUI_006645 [Cystoisospora suis]|uniref:Uncharacterized protein n=1 Tax=Cystoisospora suis TaxID=483139 RepID=A0A2C6KTS8_9APIC|nr:hypothetical protein CSUI_006645 [Cystoisospora suis]
MSSDTDGLIFMTAKRILEHYGDKIKTAEASFGVMSLEIFDDKIKDVLADGALCEISAPPLGDTHPSASVRGASEWLVEDLEAFAKLIVRIGGKEPPEAPMAERVSRFLECLL